MDYGSIIAYYYLLNRTSSIHQHTIYPTITRWVHQSNSFSRFAPVTFPDALPTSHVKLIEGDFLEEFDNAEGAYDAIVTLFFIDMSMNIAQFLKQIHRLLKPGGTWINLGRAVSIISRLRDRR